MTERFVLGRRAHGHARVKTICATGDSIAHNVFTSCPLNVFSDVCGQMQFLGL